MPKETAYSISKMTRSKASFVAWNKRKSGFRKKSSGWRKPSKVKNYSRNVCEKGREIWNRRLGLLRQTNMRIFLRRSNRKLMLKKKFIKSSFRYTSTKSGTLIIIRSWGSNVRNWNRVPLSSRGIWWTKATVAFWNLRLIRRKTRTNISTRATKMPISKVLLNRVLKNCRK